MKPHTFTHPDDASEDHVWETDKGEEVTQLKAFKGVKLFNPLVAVVNGELHAFTTQGNGFSSYLRDKPKKQFVYLQTWRNGKSCGVVSGDSLRERMAKYSEDTFHRIELRDEDIING